VRKEQPIEREGTSISHSRCPLMPSSEDRFPRILFIVTSPICTKAAASSSYLPLPRPFPLPHPHPQLLHKQQHCPNTPPRHVTVLHWLSLLPCPCLCPALLTYAALATIRRGPWSYHRNTFLLILHQSLTTATTPSSAPAARTRRRSPLQRFQLQI
jgi:hypothetical protein